MSRLCTFSEAILEATDQKMAQDPSVYLMGLGVPDPKGIFGTTLGLQEKYGKGRVMDMPTSENAMTGVAIGSALVGMRPIVTHQRVDFMLLGLDQLINNAAKWREMFGEQHTVPLVIRLMIGRGWGQGPQHSQTLHSLFAHIPGLKVVSPSKPLDAKGLLVSAIEDEGPVVFLEHRWLHGITGEVPRKLYRTPLGKADVLRKGSDLTIVASSHMTLDAWKAAALLEKEGISAEIIDLRTLIPLDKKTVLASVKKTGKVLICDPDWKTCGFAAELMAVITEEVFDHLTSPPARITYPDAITPTSWVLANHYYPTEADIVFAALKMLGRPASARKAFAAALEKKMGTPLDVPDKTFTGPF